MTEKKRFTYLDYSRDGYIGSFYLNDKTITNEEVWALLNKQEEQLKPFINLAKDYHLTLNQLFDICSECIDKLDSIYGQKEYGDGMIEKYRVINGFDYKNEPCKLIEDIEIEERYSTENDLEANSLCKLLNKQEETIQDLKCRINSIYAILREEKCSDVDD